VIEMEYVLWEMKGYHMVVAIRYKRRVLCY